jgi:hypothetical protein
MCVLIFFATFVLNISHSENNSVVEHSRQFFEKYPNVKLHENPYRGNRVVPCGWTDGDRHDEAHNTFSHLYEIAYKLLFQVMF